MGDAWIEVKYFSEGEEEQSDYLRNTLFSEGIENIIVVRETGYGGRVYSIAVPVGNERKGVAIATKIFGEQQTVPDVWKYREKTW